MRLWESGVASLWHHNYYVLLTDKRIWNSACFTISLRSVIFRQFIYCFIWPQTTNQSASFGRQYIFIWCCDRSHHGSPSHAYSRKTHGMSEAFWVVKAFHLNWERLFTHQQNWSGPDAAHTNTRSASTNASKSWTTKINSDVPWIVDVNTLFRSCRSI